MNSSHEVEGDTGIHSSTRRSGDSCLQLALIARHMVVFPGLHDLHRQLFVPQQQAPHDARCSHHSLVDQTGGEACRCAQRGIVRSSRPSSVEHKRSARCAWSSTTLLFGPVCPLSGAMFDNIDGINSVSSHIVSNCSVLVLFLLHMAATQHPRRRRLATAAASETRRP